MASITVLLLGGHGKIALKLTPLLLAKKWNVTSVVRNPDHEQEILQLGQGQPGQVKVLVASLDDVNSTAKASEVLDQVNPDIVVWSAGRSCQEAGALLAEDASTDTTSQAPAERVAQRGRKRSTRLPQNITLQLPWLDHKSRSS